MANVFKPKRSSTAAKVPTTTDLASGEIGVNMADQKVYINNGTSVVQVGAGKLSGHADVTLTSLTTGQTLQWNGTAWVNVTGGGGAVTGVTATAPVVSSGGTAPVISMAAATASVNGYMTSTYAAKLDGIAAGATANTGTVTNVTGTAPISVATGTTTPAISISAATTLAAGSMSAADKSKLDGIASGATANTGTVTSVSGTGTASGLTLSGNVTTSGSLTLSGTVNSLAAGSYGISVTGSAASCTGNSATATTASSVNSVINGASFANNWNTDFQNTTAYTTKIAGDTSTGSATGGPGGTWWFQQNMRHSNSGGYWGVQVAWGWEDNANILKTRNVQNGTFGSWVTYINSSNIGSQSVNYATSAGSCTGNAATATTATNLSGGSISATTGAFSGLITTAANTAAFTGANDTTLSVRSNGSAAATMSFHRPGVYAVNFGLDTDNVLKVGGWSMGGVAHAILHAGNFSSYAAKAGAAGSIVETPNTISANYTMTTGSNGVSAGPITIATGVTVTIPTGSNWVIV